MHRRDRRAKSAYKEMGTLRAVFVPNPPPKTTQKLAERRAKLAYNSICGYLVCENCEVKYKTVRSVQRSFIVTLHQKGQRIAHPAAKKKYFPPN